MTNEEDKYVLSSFVYKIVNKINENFKNCCSLPLLLLKQRKFQSICLDNSFYSVKLLNNI